MKKIATLLSLLIFTLTSIAQSGTGNQLTINKSVGIIDGQNSSYEAFTCKSSETAWAIKYTSIADSENIRVFYYKTTDNNCVISFPDSTLIPQPNGREGVNISGRNITLESSSKGFFIIIVVRDGAAYKVSCTRISE